MASSPIPGSYPESVPPTPEETMHHPVQSEQYHVQQRSKLHKPGDPRGGHQHTDSGIGMTDPEPPVSAQSGESTPTGPGGAVGGGGDYTQDRAQPIQPPETIRTEPDAQTWAHGSAAAQTGPRDSGDRVVNPGAGVSGSSSERGGLWKPKTANGNTETSGGSAPYWGNLPKPAEAEGGVYNKVTGHGSATDDHDEHHHLPARSASSPRTVIAGRIAGYPRGGGVYNTVTGHGSQDDEARRHSRRPSDDTPGHTSAGPGPASDKLAGPLPDIPEERQRTEPPGAYTGSRDIDPGFLPEKAVRDDVLLAEAASRNSATTSTKAVGTPPTSDQGSHRAFPLATGVHDDHERREFPPVSQGEALAGAAGLGAGAVGSESANRHRSISPPTRENWHSGSPRGRSSHEAAGVRAPVQKSNSHEESPKGEKKHRVLGIFHRHKDEGHGGRSGSRRKSVSGHPERGRDDAAVAGSHTQSRLRKRSKDTAPMGRKDSPPLAGRNENSGHGKEKAAAGAAAGAGMFGLLHRKSHSVSEGSHDTARRVSRPLPADDNGAGPVEDVSTPFEHPREPPPAPDAGGGSGNYNLLAGGVPSGIKPSASSAAKDTTQSSPDQSGKYNTLASGTPSGINPAAAAGASSKDTEPRGSGDDLGSTWSGRPTRQATNKDTMHQEPRGYNVPPSSGTSTAEKQSISQGHAGNTGVLAREPGPYNTLASGVPSGVKSDPGAAEAGHPRSGGATSADAETGDGGAEYNTLSSGTPSGVKVKPKSAQRAALPNDRAEQHKDLPAPASQHASQGFSAPRKPDDGSPADDVTAYPHPDMVHNMSPEVMPAAYTASSAPRSSPSSDPRQMSPEVMPAAYTESYSPRRSPPGGAGAQADRQTGTGAGTGTGTGTGDGFPLQVREKGFTEKDRSGVNPALAAATTSWATAAGKSSGVVVANNHAGGAPSRGSEPGQGRVVHRCLHCGRDNDITGYLAQFGSRAV